MFIAERHHPQLMFARLAQWFYGSDRVSEQSEMQSLRPSAVVPHVMVSKERF